ncbi:MAG: hypothetical protein ACRDCW_18205 [Sarcina sp.]
MKIDKIMDTLYSDEIATDLDIMNEISPLAAGDCCQPIEFCCLITVPTGSVVQNDLAHVTFDPECIKLKKIDEFDETILGCPVKLAKYRVKACVTLHGSLNILKDDSLGAPVIYRHCCNSCKCIKGCVICCNKDITSIDNIIIDAVFTKNPEKVTTDSCGTDVYKLSGEIKISLDNCDCTL